MYFDSFDEPKSRFTNDASRYSNLSFLAGLLTVKAQQKKQADRVRLNGNLEQRVHPRNQGPASVLI